MKPILRKLSLLLALAFALSALPQKPANAVLFPNCQPPRFACWCGEDFNGCSSLQGTCRICP